MATMYEMIMDLPLFKGVGKDQVSQFLEKTNIGFHNFEPGETVAISGDDVTMVRFVISGEIRVIHTLEAIPLSVEQICGAGNVISAERLFGISTGYPFNVLAATRVSIMEFSKDQYINLLQSDRIYMLNFFNYLSLRAQRPVDTFSEYAGGDIRNRLSQLVGIFTIPGSHGIIIRGTDDALAAFTGSDEESLAEWKAAARREGLIEYADGILRVLSRDSFLA